MYGVVKLPFAGLTRSGPSPYRQFSCSLCVAFRQSFGLLGPLLHTTDLAFFALLAPAGRGKTFRTTCSAVPFLRPRVVPPNGTFIQRLRSLGLAMATLRELDADLDGDRRGPVRRFLRRKTTGPAADEALALLSVTPADLETVARETQAREADRGLPFAETLGPVTAIARRLFAALFDGIHPASPAERLGVAYVETLSLLDGFEDREEDRRRDRFNVCEHASFDDGSGPAERLLRSAETFGRTALELAPPEHADAVRTALDASLGPTVSNAVSVHSRRNT